VDGKRVILSKLSRKLAIKIKLKRIFYLQQKPTDSFVLLQRLNKRFFLGSNQQRNN
jgi:hypothetical protein